MMKNLYKIAISMILSGVSVGSVAGGYSFRAPVKVDFVSWKMQTDYSDWEPSGEPYNCINDIDEEDVYYGKTAEQVQTCSQDETSTKTITRTNTLGYSSSTSEDVSTTKDVVITNEIVGTHLSGSCKEALDFDGTIETGRLKIAISSSDNLTVYCDMDTSGGGWTLVFNHNKSGGYFNSASQANFSNPGSPSLSTNKYSILKYIGRIKSGSKYEFKMNWKGYSSYQQWKQSSNPTTSKVSGYEGIHISSKSNYWGGIERSSLYPSNGSSYIDGSVNHSNWFYSIGAYTQWGSSSHSGIPASNDVAGTNVGVKNVNLWLR